MSVVAYPVANKAKSLDICSAFVTGCGGDVALDGKYREGSLAFFYGVDESNVEAWRAVCFGMKHTYYYCDNSYFDKSRQTYFRITKNALQHCGYGESTGYRFAQLGIDVKPWRDSGEHIVVCPQSGHFMRYVEHVLWDWTEAVTRDLRRWTTRALRVREWSPNKGKLSRTLEADLDGAHALVTFSSAAAVTAVLSGVPAVCTGAAAASAMGGTIKKIDALPTPERETWAGVLADNQWTLDEMRCGQAWMALNA